MRLNKRGEVFTVGVVTAGILVGILGFLAGASGLRRWIPGLSNKDQVVKQTYVSKTESKPIIVTGQDGKSYFLQATKSEVSNLASNEEAKMTLKEKLLVLPKLWLLLMVLGIFFPPIAALMAFVNSRLKGAAKQIVSGVENGLATLEHKSPEAKQAMLDSLSKKYDASTKKLVANIKKDI